jgi:hypothetical protein
MTVQAELAHGEGGMSDEQRIALEGEIAARLRSEILDQAQGQAAAASQPANQRRQSQARD